MMKPIPPRSLLAAALALACGASPYADTKPDMLEDYGDFDTKLYPATFCNSNKPGAISFTQDGKALNPSTSKTYEITCPVFRDRLYGVDSDGLLASANFDMVLLLVSKKTSADITCYLRSSFMFDNYSAGYAQTYTISGPASDDYYPARFFDAPSNDYITTAGCRIPSATGNATSTRSGIVGYYAVEGSEAH